jgi:hypothetical protein
MYESRRQSLLPYARFAQRVAMHFLVALALVAVSLGIGMAGYSYFEQMAWRDAFVNSAMLLGGMGPVDPLQTDGGKVFAGIYALYAGLIFLVASGIILAPMAHRILHRFHLEAKDAA